MKIEITNEDIDKGGKYDSAQCPVARALRRAGLVHFGVIGPTVMIANPDGGITQLALPRHVQDWIESFDASWPVQPMIFDLDLPEPSQRCQNRSYELLVPIDRPPDLARASLDRQELGLDSEPQDQLAAA